MVQKENLLITSMILLITYTISISLVSQAYPQTQTTTTISATGNIQIQADPGIGVYQDQTGTPLTQLNWGTLQPGENPTITTYIKNEGNVPITLSLQTDNWNPQTAQNYLTLSWNYNNQPLNPEETAQITLTLEIDPNTTGITTFTFDITIIAQ
jgi:uncharacterized membrane protein